MKREQLIAKIVDKQFEMIGEKITLEGLPDDGMIEIGKKKMYWYDHYKFDNLEQYEEWRSWAEKEIKVLPNWLNELNFIDLLYGMSYKIPKIQKGQLDLF
jgi:hypothetical protein